MFRASALTILVIFSPLIGPAEASCDPPAAIDDGWAVSKPDMQQLDTASLCAINTRLEELENANANGVVVVRNGAIVHEVYFSGKDLRWPQRHWGEPPRDTDHDARTKHDVQSITKSVVALLVGIALDRGLIKNIDAPLLSFFPDQADLTTPERARITLRDVLTMRAGLDWPAKPYLGMARKVDAALDPYRLVLQQPMVTQPGQTWRYNNGAAELVGGVVRKASGRRIDDFAREFLFEPLGITDWEWGTMANGDPGASWGLRMRPRDLAKIGQLVLNKGSWQGRQIVSVGWIDEMTLPRVEQPNFSYGYLWWLDHRSLDGQNFRRIKALGWGGQCLVIIPKLAIVVAVTAGVYDYDGKGAQYLACDTTVDAGVMPAALGR